MSPRRDKRRYGRKAKDVRRGGLGTHKVVVPSSIKTISLWLRVNGVDVANSNIIQSITPTTDVIEAIAFSHIVSLQANDYCELVFAVNDLAVTIKSSPIRIFSPATPSVTLNMTQIQSRG